MYSVVHVQVYNYLKINILQYYIMYIMKYKMYYVSLLIVKSNRQARTVIIINCIEKSARKIRKRVQRTFF